MSDSDKKYWERGDQYHYLYSMLAEWELGVWLTAEFRSEKILRNKIDSEKLPLFRGRKYSFLGIPKFTEEHIPKLGTEGNGMTKISFTKNPSVCLCFCSTEQNSQLFSLPRNGSERNSRTKFCSMAQNSEHFSTLRNSSERNSENFPQKLPTLAGRQIQFDDRKKGGPSFQKLVP